MRQQFLLGRIVVTPEGLERMDQFGVEPGELVNRHARGEWGELDAEDVQENEISVREGFRILLRRQIFADRTRPAEHGRATYRAAVGLIPGEILTLGTSDRQDTLTLARNDEPVGIAVITRDLRGLVSRAEAQLRGIVLSARPSGDNHTGATRGDLLLLRLPLAKEY